MIRWFEKHNKISLAIAILIAVVIFYLSSLKFEYYPGVMTPSNIRSLLYHIFVFFLFTLFLLISLLQGKGKFSIFILAIVISIIYGISDEIHQFFVPGRFCSLLDVGVNGVGILFASMSYLILIKYRERKNKYISITEK